MIVMISRKLQIHKQVELTENLYTLFTRKKLNHSINKTIKLNLKITSKSRNAI